jgi:ketosteroid isomerase-like protein
MISKIVAIASVCAVLGGTAAVAAPDTGAVKETVRKFWKAGNDKDAAAGMALLTADGSIIDEFAPFRWDSFKDWGAAFSAYNSQNGVAHTKTTFVKFAHVNVEGDRAYAVAAVAYTYTEGGKARKENGTETFTLEKQAGGWRIASFAWASKAGVDQGADATAVIDAVHTFTSMATPPSPPPSAIVDEFAPYHWTGASANADWFAGLQKSMAQEHSTGIALKLAAPDQLSVNGDNAYAAFPTIITSKVHGKAMAEHGEFAFALDKSAGAWHITSWAWATK